MKILIFARKARVARNAPPPNTIQRHEHKMKTKWNQHKQNEKIWKTHVFWKPCIFSENTHICEKTEGHGERPAPKNKNKHTFQKDAENQKQKRKIRVNTIDRKQNEKRKRSENHASLRKMLIFARKTRLSRKTSVARNAPPPQQYTPMKQNENKMKPT